MSFVKLTRVATRLSSSLISNRLLSTQNLIIKKPQKLILINNKKFSVTSINKYAEQEKLNKQQIEQKVLDILRNFDRVKENAAKPTVTLESHLMKDLGLDSLDQVEIVVQLEDTFGYEIPDSDYEKLNTPNEIVNYIQKRLAEV